MQFSQNFLIWKLTEKLEYFFFIYLFYFVYLLFFKFISSSNVGLKLNNPEIENRRLWGLSQPGAP